MALEALGLSFRYPGSKHAVLHAYDLRLEAGERVGLTAPSGQGKTTLCALLAGYRRPDAGTVLVDGQPLAAYNGYCPVQMIWQHPEHALNPRMRMRDALAEGEGMEASILEGLGIEQAWLSRFPGELSGGELQRFCIARALGRRTRYLLADEITTMLDFITQSQIWHFLLDELAHRNIGLLAISHAPPLLARISTRTLCLESPYPKDP